MVGGEIYWLKMRVGNCLEVLLIHHYTQINRDGHGIFLLFYFTKGMMKGGNKQEEAWINPFVKQFSNISFSVSMFSWQPPSLLMVIHKLTLIP